MPDKDDEAQEPKPTGRVVYGKAHADLSTVATDELEENK